MLYHITSRENWAEAEIKRSYRATSLTTDGYIHLSTDKQLLATANRFFPGKSDLLVLAVNEKNLECEVKYEEADGDSYPHLYGELNVDAVVEVVALPVTTSGEFDVPAEWSAWRSNFDKLKPL